MFDFGRRPHFSGGVRFAIASFSVALTSFCAGYLLNSPSPPVPVAKIAVDAPVSQEKSAPGEPDQSRGRDAELAKVLGSYRASPAGDAALCAEFMRWKKEDFRATADDSSFPATLTAARERAATRDFENHILRALAMRWAEVDKEGALEWMESPKTSHQHINDLRWALAREIPAEVLARVAQKPFTTLRFQALCGLAARDPAAAQRFFATLPVNDRSYEETNLIEGLVQGDPVAAVNACRAGMSAGHDVDSIRRALERGLESAPTPPVNVLRQMAELAPDGYTFDTAMRELSFSPRDVLEVAAGQPPNNRRLSWSDYYLRQAFTELASENPQSALQFIQRFEGERRAELLEDLARGWAFTDPSGVMAWLDGNGPKGEAGYAARRAALSEWLAYDETAARKWLAAQPPGEARDSATAVVARLLEENGRGAEAKTLMQTVNPNSTSLDAMRHAVSISAGRPGEALDRFVSGAGTDEKGLLRIEKLASTAAASQPDEVRKWIDQQPVGVQRDAAAAGWVATGVKLDIEASRGLVETIADPWARTRAAISLYKRWRERDADSARSWLAALSEIDPVVRDAAMR